MAKLTGADSTYSRKGIREDLSDAIYDISPEDTVFLNMIGRDSASATLFDWQVDALRTAVTTNQVQEGNEPTFSGSSATTRLGNYCEIAEDKASVTGTVEVVNKAGRRSEMAYQLSRASAALKLDMESSLLANKGANGGGESTARQTAAMGSWFYSNVSHNGTNPSYTNIPTAGRTDGTQRTFLESHLVTVLETGWGNGAKFKVLMVGAYNKRIVSTTFTGLASRTQDVGQRSTQALSIVATADVYVGDFHVVRVIPNRLQRARDAWVLDPEFLAVAYLRPFHTDTFGKKADAEQKVVRAEYALKVKNEKASGAVFDLTTS